MNHEMGISRTGFFGAIMAYCSCGWTSNEISGRKIQKKASKAFQKHLPNEELKTKEEWEREFK